ncbi:MAG: TA system VapC family ribonuclease toxin [Aestuariivirga sp.]
MIAVDTNILVYAHREDGAWHTEASARLRELAEGMAAWAIPWPCLHEFISIVTHPRIYKPPTPLMLALAQIDAWLESPRVVLLCEAGTYWDCLKRLALQARLAGPQIHDARVAALCIEHDVTELWTADRDFSRFTALKTRNPLAET